MNGAAIADIAARVYLDLAEVLFVAVGTDGRLLHINRKGCEVLGYPENELIGQRFELFLPERLRSELVNVFQKLIAGDAASTEYYENAILTRSGEERLIAWHNALLRDASGAIQATLASGSDITEQRRAESALGHELTKERAAARALEHSESTLRGFYDGAPYLMGIGELLDDDVRIVSCNRAMAAFYDRALTDVVGRTTAELGVPPKNRRGVVEKYREAISEKKVVRFRFRRDGATSRSMHVTLSPLLSAGAERPLCAFITEDITEREDLQARVLLSDRMASIGTLAAGVAHEINNPLAYVATNLDIIASALAAPGEDGLPPADTDVSRAVMQAREGIERVRQIVKGLRTFSRGDEDRREPIRVEDVIESSLKMVWNEIRHRAELERDYAGVPPVLANAARLGQLFLNLLVNAAHAIPEGHASSNLIRVATRMDEAGRVVAEVSDTGSGIAPEIIDRIFDPFFTTRPVGSGTGLGLAVCHGIVRALDGEITVESQVGKGSTFRVFLAAAPGVALRPASKPAPSAAVHRGRVLVVDDEPLLRMSLRSLLGGEHDVTTASSAREVMTRITAGDRYDVLLCDLMMPEMTGMDLHDKLRVEAPDQADRMVFLTGGVFTARAQTFLDRVPNPCLEKPFDMNGLREVIQKLLRKGS